ncbi:MAG TPA: hypothetical protein VGS06_28940 [Streptosporangiaceae bacterium]|nr:hypothetical protein [Streptosporangiaceae bacterium]
MDRPSLIAVVIPLMIPIALFTGLALPFIAARRSGRRHAGRRLASADALKRTGGGRTARPREPGGDDAAFVRYLYVPCVRIRHHGSSAEIRRWVQAVPVVKTTAKWIYYTSDSWDRHEAVVSPGCISRQEFETDTRCHDVRCARHGYTWEHCRHGEDRCRHGYPAGVIPIPGHRHRPGPADRLFFATRQAAEDHLYRAERQQTGQAAPQGPPLKELRRAMADAHPDRGGTAEQFIQARRRYQTALGFARW